MLQSINTSLSILESTQNNDIIAIVFAALAVLVIILRLLLWAGYGTQYGVFVLQAKEIKDRIELKAKEEKGTLLSRVLRDYVMNAEKGAGQSAAPIVEKHLLRLRLIFIGYNGLASFIGAVEKGLPLLGVALAFTFQDRAYLYLALTALSFLLFALFGALFSCQTLRQRLALDMSAYVEREAGQFFVGDTPTLLTRLRSELSLAIVNQGDRLSGSIQQMGRDVSAAVTAGLLEMSKGLQGPKEQLIAMGDELRGPMSAWRESITEAAAAQTEINKALTQMNRLAEEQRQAAQLLENGFARYHADGEARVAQMAAQAEQLKAAVALLSDTGRAIVSSNETVEKQVRYLEQNQRLLDESLSKYEQSLMTLTERLGEGLGGWLTFHANQSAAAVNESLKENIDKFMLSNNELLIRLQEALESVKEQSRSETQTLLKLKEQMDIHFTGL